MKSYFTFCFYIVLPTVSFLGSGGIEWLRGNLKFSKTEHLRFAEQRGNFKDIVQKFVVPAPQRRLLGLRIYVQNPEKNTENHGNHSQQGRRHFCRVSIQNQTDALTVLEGFKTNLIQNAFQSISAWKYKQYTAYLIENKLEIGFGDTGAVTD